MCAASAIASLPRGLIHPLWLTAFIVPSACFLFLGTGNRRHYVPAWFRFSAAALLQAAAAYATFLCVGSLDNKSSLACSLLPALTFFTLRREPSDTSLSLFLSFCFLLIGIMLNQNRTDWTLLLFLAACVWAMQIEASNRALLLRHSARGRPMARPARFLRRTQVVVALMLFAFLAYFGIEWIPSPGGDSNTEANPSADTSRNRRVMGLNSRFDLSGAVGSPLNLASDRVIRVEDPQGWKVPSDLYLRMTFFDQAGVDEWAKRPHSHQRTAKRNLSCRRGSPEFPNRRLTVHRLAPAPAGELYLPPGTIRIVGVPRLEFDRSVGHYRSISSPVERWYQVEYEQLHKYELMRPIVVENRTQSWLVRVPRKLRISRQLTDLAHELAGPRPEDYAPMIVAHRIAHALQARCRYTLREPMGGFGDAVHNFLFGSRTGYCMHFATALAVMLRLNDIPCRIAVGFHAGKEEGDHVIFGSQHAHAWVELPIEKLGWMLIDPTPPADRTRRGWPEPAKEEALKPESEEQLATGAGSSCFLTGFMPFLDEPLAILGNPLEHPGAFLSLTGLFLAITIGIVMLVVRRRRLVTSGPNKERKTPDCIRVRRLLDQILKILARRGHPKNHRATLEQYLGNLRYYEVDIDLPALAHAFHAYQEVRFGGMRLDEARDSRLAAGLATAEELPA